MNESNETIQALTDHIAATTTPTFGPSNDVGVLPEEWVKAEEIAKLARKNLQFAKLAPAAKRVAIATDVLTWLRLKKITPHAGSFIERIVGSDNDVTIDGGTCYACALGAMVVCHLERTALIHKPVMGVKRLYRGGGGGRTEIKGMLGAYFDTNTLALIECAFERTVEYGTAAHVTEDTALSYDYDMCRYIHPRARAAKWWGDQASRLTRSWDETEQANVRMTAIMLNIVRNKGEFNLDQPPVLK